MQESTADDATEFEGLRQNPDLTIRAHEHIILSRQRQLEEILADLEENDWVKSGETSSWEGLRLELDAVVYDEAALAHSIGRDFRPTYVKARDDGKLNVELKILEWEDN